MKIKKIVSCLLVILISFVFAGCSETAVFNSFKEITNAANFSGIVTENANYIFEWDNTNNCVILKNKQDGEIAWNSIPDEICTSSEDNTSVFFAPINVSYLEPTTNQVKTVNGASGIENVSVEKNGDTLKAYYSFDSIEICVPVTYSLEDDGFSVEVNSNELTEGSYKIYQIALLPYNVSAKNDNNNENWLFVPYGSGAVMYTDDAVRSERKFEEDVYGTDYSVTRDEVFNTDTGIKMPVFAAGGSSKSIFAIIESGAEYVTLTASAGNSGLQYSNITPIFRLRGYNITNVQYSGKTGKQIVRISDTKVDDTFKIRYHILNEGKNFVKMASIYREFLNETYGEQEQSTDNSVLLNFVGGADTVKYAAGIKYSKLTAATTLAQVTDIIGDFESVYKGEPLICLTGFGSNGAKISEIAGGYSLSSTFGNKKVLTNLLSNNQVLIDYELMRYSKSGNGFSTLWDASKNANNGTVKLFEYDLATKVSDEDGTVYRLLRRDMIDDASEKLIKSVEDIKPFGISTGSMGYTAYSDYTDGKYTAKGLIDEEISEIVKGIAEKGYNVAVKNANDYAAATSSIVSDAPIDNGTLSCLDQSIPFYSMVFKGYTQLYSKSLNLADDFEKTLLDSVSNGVGLQYTLCENADLLRNSTYSSVFARSVYGDIKNGISDTLKLCSDLLNKISTAKISGWSMEENGTAVTQFDNGVTVYCNYSDVEVQTPCGTIPSMGFAYSEGR